MSTFDDASLVLIPSGYKASKVYSVKPTDGTGDLTFTRSLDTATRVGADGLIERVRTNLILQSNTFSDAAWTKTNLTLTSGQSDPFGGSNAWKFECTSTSGGMIQTVAGSGVRTVSIFAKAGNIDTFSLWRGNVLSVGVSFNLTTGTIISGIGTITPVGGGWFRCSTFGDTAHVNPFFNSPTSGDFIFLAFSQLENSDIATPYIPTTTAAVSVGMLANVPRLDYLGGGCPKLLLEPQRTNLQIYSENSALWTQPADGLTVVYNTTETLDPAGFNGAEKVTAVSGNRRMFEISSVAAGAFTVSAFLKVGTGNVFDVVTTSGSLGVTYNIATGVVTNIVGTGTITNYGNGWYRITATGTSAGPTEVVQYRFPNSAGEFMYFYGAQVEAGSYATSYIPTLGAAVTRSADFPVNLPTAISLSGDFCLFWEGTALETDLMLYGSGNSTWYMNILGSAGRIILDTNTGRKVQGTINSLVVGTKAKILIRRQSGAHNIFVNGVKLINQVSVNDTTTLSLSSMFWGFSATFYKGQTINQSLIFQTALSDTDCIALTA